MRAAGVLHVAQSLRRRGRVVLLPQRARPRRHMTEPHAKRARTTRAEEGETDRAWRKRLRIIVDSPASGDSQGAQVSSGADTSTLRLGSAASDTDLHCPFADKDKVKGLGARFDWERKVWYVPEGTDLHPFQCWLPAATCAEASSAAPNKWHDFPNRRPSAASLRILSWNVAELIPSQVALKEWGPNSQLRGVRHTVRAERPDVVLLQECPCNSFELDAEGYVCCGSTSSHCGFVCTYVRRDFKRTPVMAVEATLREAAVEPMLEVSQVVIFPADLPAVGLLLRLEDVGTLAIVNCHLAPHGPGAATRAEQVAAIGSALSNAPETAVPDAVVLAGDCNMRNHEVEPNGRSFGNFGFPLRHCRYEGHRYGLYALKFRHKQKVHTVGNWPH